MSTIFVETPKFPLSRQPPPGFALHQSNSWMFTSPWGVVQLWAERRSQRKTLGELAGEQHLLDDIGLSRAQALREAAKPFWRQ